MKGFSFPSDASLRRSLLFNVVDGFDIFILLCIYTYQFIATKKSDLVFLFNTDFREALIVTEI